MKLLLLLLSLSTINQAFSQKKLFDTLKVDATTKIIGRYPQYDKAKTYEKYNFIIEDSARIVDFIKSLTLGKEVENTVEEPNFEILVVKNHDEIGSWAINPVHKSALTHDGHTYSFDLNQISELNKIYPFTYFYEIKIFNNKNEYWKYLDEQKKKSNFLFYYGPQFEYEGSFEIEFPKNSKFPHPKGISDFLKPYIEKIVKKGEYRISYALNDKNRKNMEQYTMTISGPKRLFTELKIENFKPENWQPTVEDAYFFYKK